MSHKNAQYKFSEINSIFENVTLRYLNVGYHNGLLKLMS